MSRENTTYFENDTNMKQRTMGDALWTMKNWLKRLETCVKNIT